MYKQKVTDYVFISFNSPAQNMTKQYIHILNEQLDYFILH